MSSARKLREKPVSPKALVCGMLQDGGRILFLVSKDQHGTERLELPCFLAYSDADVTRLAQEFREQTGIDAEVGEIKIQTKNNAGSRKRKVWVPCLVFKMNAKNRTAKPAKQFSGFRWLTLEDTKKQKLGRNAEWMLKK
ncbi:hypothetical protein KKF81_05645 [Candidatus Micrarchaeota archaeon]|nr:hypothetical protein [Candidatus Micrarchaeota archaeon]MBU1166412.1 hypothetical protein [Candidatus Micrarchaeota archaeon]MBU1886905.1 hypothetical protein [Candidatus Micrarchaeota archaeon]